MLNLENSHIKNGLFTTFCFSFLFYIIVLLIIYTKYNNNNNNNKSFILHTLEYKISSAQHNGAQLCIILVLKTEW